MGCVFFTIFLVLCESSVCFPNQRTKKSTYQAELTEQLCVDPSASPTGLFRGASASLELRFSAEGSSGPALLASVVH